MALALKKNPKVDLRRKYLRSLEISFVIALAFLIIAFKYYPSFEKEEIKTEAAQELVQVEDVDVTQQQAAPPSPPKPLVPIEAPADSEFEDIEIQSSEMDDLEVSSTPPPPPSQKKEEIQEEEEPVYFVAVEEQPAPIGGIEAIQASIVYPEMARKAGIQGRVYVRAYVDERGVVTKVELLKGIGGGCDEEAMKAVKATKFSPGKQRGKAVKVQVSVPITFKLK